MSRGEAGQPAAGAGPVLDPLRPEGVGAAERPWTHLSRPPRSATGGKGKPRSPDLKALAEAPLDDVLYFPPVPPRRAAARDEAARDRLMGGTPVLVQLLPGEESTVPPWPARRSSSTCCRSCWSATSAPCGAFPPVPRRSGRCSPG